MPKRNKIRVRSSSERVLLINPPIYDIRLHWPKWQVPATLLQVGAEKTAEGADVKLIDTIWTGGKRIPRRQQGCILADETAIQYWRLGTPIEEFQRQLKELGQGWTPDIVIIEGFATFWWQGVAEAVRLCHEVWPRVEAVVIGAYARLAPKHVQSTAEADLAVPYPPIAKTVVTDLSLYQPLNAPSTAQLRLPADVGDIKGMLGHVATARSQGAQEFSLEIEDLQLQRDAIGCLRVECARAEQSIPFDILGCLSPHAYLTNPECVKDLRAIGLRHVVFADDRCITDADDAANFLEACSEAASLFHAAGYRPRTDSVTASLCIGKQGEDFSERVRAATILNHSVGSVILWPYQPTPKELPRLSLEKHNGKLFPMRRKSDLTYADYAEFVALNAVLNSRYRDCSFDFLGSGLIPSLLAGSVKREAWNADESVKGSTALPMRVVK